MLPWIVTFLQVVISGYALPPTNPSIVFSPTSHSVKLTWTASTTSGVVAYSVYRSTTSGGPYTKLSRVDKSPYTDVGISAGNTYYYVTTASTASLESTFSNQVVAVIPSGGGGGGGTVAIGTPTLLGSAQTAQTTAQTSVAMNLGAGIGAGTLVILAGENGSASTTGGFPTSVTDDHGNTYLLAQNESRGTFFDYIYYFYYVSAPGQTTATVNSFASTNFTAHRAYSVSGIASSSIDAIGQGQGLSNSASVTATSQNVLAGELVFAILAVGNGGVLSITSWPPTTGYSALGAVTSNTTRNVDVAWAYKIVSSVETSSSADTIRASLNWIYVLATFKGAVTFAGDEDFGPFPQLNQVAWDSDITVWQ